VVQLGWHLYFDPDLSGDPTWRDMLDRPTTISRASVLCPRRPLKISCATCHDPSQGGGDVTSVPRHVGVGAGSYDVNGQQTLNVAHYDYLYWNGRADTVWAQAAQVMESPVSMNGDRLSIVWTVLRKYPQFLGLVGETAPPTGPAEASSCRSLTDCPPAACHLVPEGSPTPLACRPLFPEHGKAGRKVGCQWNSDSPLDGEALNDELDCMRPADRTRMNKIYVKIAKAIAAYEWYLSSVDSPFDRYAAQGPASTAISPEAQRGLQLFVGRASCIDCHRSPLFSDNQFHFIGIPQAGAAVPTLADCSRSDTAAACNCLSGSKCLPWGGYDGLKRLGYPVTAAADLAASDGGASGTGSAPLCAGFPTLPGEGESAPSGSLLYNRCSTYSGEDMKSRPRFLAFPAVKGSWRTPSLRDVGLTGPYMHDGIFPSLSDVVWHYDQGIASVGVNTNLADAGTEAGVSNQLGPVAVELKPLHLSSRDRGDLVAFLESLTGRPRPPTELFHLPPGDLKVTPLAPDVSCTGPSEAVAGTPDAGAGTPDAGGDAP
jgi:cytochrome c peroxidase